MDSITIYILYELISKAGYTIKMADLERQYLSHPDMGMLSSITDTLNDFKIPNEAAEINPSTIFELTEPFIAFIRHNQTEQFVLITIANNKEIELFNGKDKPFNISFTEFENIFSGIIVAIDSNAERNRLTISLSSPILFQLSGVLAIVYLIFFNHEPNVSRLLYGVTALAGLAFSILLYAKALGANNALLNRFCTLTKTTDCNLVLQSGAAKIGKYISLTDIGIIYFAFQCFYQLANHELSLLYAISIIAALFSFYSVYQQAVVIKKWCPLCLGVVGILLMQGVLAVSALSNISIQINYVFLTLCILVLSALAWYFVKPLIAKSNQLKEKDIELLGFKRNYHLFLPFYISAPTIHDDQLTDTQQIIIGRKNAPVQITLITNPLCKACQKAHAVLNVLLQQYPKDLALRIVFYVPFQNLHDPRTMIAGWLVDTYSTDKQTGIDAIEKWYADPDVKNFDNLRIPIEVIKMQQAFLQNHSEWCLEKQLTLTPILLLNNKLFPLIYRTEDLPYHIEAVIDFERKMYSDVHSSVQPTAVLASNT